MRQTKRERRENRTRRERRIDVLDEAEVTLDRLDLLTGRLDDLLDRLLEETHGRQQK